MSRKTISLNQQRSRKQSKTQSFYDDIQIDQQLLNKYTLLNDDYSHQQSTHEIDILKRDLRKDIRDSKSNRNYTYIRNYKFFKDKVLQPSNQPNRFVYNCKSLTKTQSSKDISTDLKLNTGFKT